MSIFVATMYTSAFMFLCSVSMGYSQTEQQKLYDPCHEFLALDGARRPHSHGLAELLLAVNPAAPGAQIGSPSFGAKVGAVPQSSAHLPASRSQSRFSSRARTANPQMFVF